MKRQGFKQWIFSRGGFLENMKSGIWSGLTCLKKRSSSMMYIFHKIRMSVPCKFVSFRLLPTIRRGTPKTTCSGLTAQKKYTTIDVHGQEKVLEKKLSIC